MNNKEQIEIPLSKTKMIFAFTGSLIFVGLGIWFLVNQSKIGTPILYNQRTIFGIASILFFGLVVITILRKFLDQKAGLMINPKGIVDNSSGLSVGMILWTDIQEITVLQVRNQKFLVIIVKNPQEYIDKMSNSIKRNVMKINYKSYGSPISISANALQTDFNKLHKLILEKMSHYKS
ncbi:STM3941 family protein [Flavobacterium hibisci]|uniref:STM3941 family protein n=1 Tax=Flavobacterium hibisci TaxID=1914462 RepID=UPI001CBC70F2|nr:STM3941 family protein [Flavobacterium hibisci]MBZ4042404.1 hypothetical protein [Flavobacterium hibisci]